jgi:molecular chaperone DnaK
MAVMEGGEPVVLENSEGADHAVGGGVHQDGERIVGEAAKRQAVTNPRNTVYSIKRFMGRKFDEVQEEIKRVPYKVVEGPNGDAHVEVEVEGEGPSAYSPPEVSAMILAKLKADAEMRWARTITQAVITVPAYFNDSQRRRPRTPADRGARSAAHHQRAHRGLAGLRSRQEEGREDRRVRPGRRHLRHLGARDRRRRVRGQGHQRRHPPRRRRLGQPLMDWILDEFKRDTGMDLRKQPDALQRIKEEAEKAKIALSSSQQYEINLPFITADASGPKHIQKSLTRAKMEQLCDDLFERTIGPVRNCLRTPGIRRDKIDELVLVGGMTRMPGWSRPRGAVGQQDRRIRG